MRWLVRRALPAVVLTAVVAGCGSKNEPAKLPDSVPPPPKNGPSAHGGPSAAGAPAHFQVEKALPPMSP